MSEDFIAATKKLVKQAATKPAPAIALSTPASVTLPPIQTPDPHRVYRSIQIDVAAEQAGQEAVKAAEAAQRTQELLKNMGFRVE